MTLSAPSLLSVLMLFFPGLLWTGLLSSLFSLHSAAPFFKSGSALSSQPPSLSYRIFKQIWGCSLETCHAQPSSLLTAMAVKPWIPVTATTHSAPRAFSCLHGNSGLCELLRPSSLVLHVPATTHASFTAVDSYFPTKQGTSWGQRLTLSHQPLQCLLSLVCDPSVTLCNARFIMVPPERMMGLAWADMIIIRIHLLKNFIYFIIPNTAFQDIFYAKPDKWIAFPRFFSLLIICIHFMFQRHFNIGQPTDRLNRHY